MSNWSKKFFERFDNLDTRRSILLNKIAENFALPKGVCAIELLSANQLYVKQKYIMILPLAPIAFEAATLVTSIKGVPASGYVPIDTGIPVWGDFEGFKFQPAFSAEGAYDGQTDELAELIGDTKAIGFRECYKGDLN